MCLSFSKVRNYRFRNFTKKSFAENRESFIPKFCCNRCMQVLDASSRHFLNLKKNLNLYIWGFYHSTNKKKINNSDQKLGAQNFVITKENIDTFQEMNLYLTSLFPFNRQVCTFSGSAGQWASSSFFKPSRLNLNK